MASVGNKWSGLDLLLCEAEGLGLGLLERAALAVGLGLRLLEREVCWGIAGLGLLDRDVRPEGLGLGLLDLVNCESVGLGLLE